MYWSSAIDIDAALRQPRQPLLAARRMDDLEARPRQAAVDQPGEAASSSIYSSVGVAGVHVAAGGT